MEQPFFIPGCRVSRKPVQNFKHQSHEEGTVVELKYNKTAAYIKWDRKNKTGQQHSTIQLKFLRII